MRRFNGSIWQTGFGDGFRDGFRDGVSGTDEVTTHAKNVRVWPRDRQRLAQGKKSIKRSSAEGKGLLVSGSIRLFLGPTLLGRQEAFGFFFQRARELR